jgi:hypothetical protein
MFVSRERPSAARTAACCAKQPARPLLLPRKWPSTASRWRRYQSVNTQTPVSEPGAEPTLTCDSCGREMPIPAGSGVTMPRARCAECEVAVAAALDDVVRQLVGLGNEAGDLPSGATACFECGAPSVADQDGIARPFVCSACGSRCFTRQARTLVAPLSPLVE